MGLAGIFIGLGLLIWLSYRGWSVLVLAPAAALVAALFASEPLLARTRTQTFMNLRSRLPGAVLPLFLPARSSAS
jgi:H+/gluconate symporter-like permease